MGITVYWGITTSQLTRAAFHIETVRVEVTYMCLQYTVSHEDA